MAKPKPPAEQAPPPAKKKKKDDKGILETAAEAIGSALGTIAVTTGIAQPKVSTKPGKLQKKNKQRTPRKLKKKLARASK